MGMTSVIKSMHDNTLYILIVEQKNSWLNFQLNDTEKVKYRILRHSVASVRNKYNLFIIHVILCIV